VLENTLAGDAVEGGVLEFEPGDVAGVELGPEGAVTGPAARFVEHRRARFDSDDRAVGADGAGEGAHDVAGAAADVEQPIPESGSEQLGRGGPQPLDGGQRACSSGAAISAAASGSASTWLRLPRAARSAILTGGSPG
jgi:hypothetical protein